MEQGESWRIHVTEQIGRPRNSTRGSTKYNYLPSGNLGRIRKWSAPNGGTIKKYNIQSNIKMLRGKDCEVENVMKFLKDIEIFEENINIQDS